MAHISFFKAKWVGLNRVEVNCNIVANMKHTHILGFDIGGTGIKGAIVDINTGSLMTERIKCRRPILQLPILLGGAVNTITNQLGYKGIIGCGFPAIVKKELQCLLQYRQNHGFMLMWRIFCPNIQNARSML